MRPRKRDVDRILAIRHQLAVVHHRRSVLDDALPAIGELMGSEKYSAYSVSPGADGLRLGLFLGRGFEADRARQAMQRLISSSPVGWTTYNPLRPEPELRNVATDLVRGLGWDALRTLAQYKQVLAPHGVANHDQLRVLVCEGETMLALVGVWRHEALFTDYERQLMQALAPDLRRALTLERQLQDAPALAAGLDAALEAIPGEAYVVGPGGHVRHANAAGRARLDRDARVTAEELRAALRGGPGFVLSRLATGGALLIRRGGSDRDARVDAAARRFGLTRRQTDVLRALASGRSNLEIAAALNLSLPTVETHLRALFEKLGCESRAGVLARLLE